jgi:hypothetical protein
MTTPATPSQPTPAGDDRNLVAVDANYIAPTLEDKLHGFWKKNGTAVVVLCVLVLVGIIAKGGWDYMAAQKEADVEKDYAAATTPEKLKAFASAHADHTLGAVAQLRLADDAYAAGKAAEAVTGYEQVVARLKTGPLATRAQLGAAMAKIAAGKTAEGETALKSLANNTAEFKGVRVEAAYQLASLAADAGRADDVKKYSDLVAQIDPASPWTQRAMTLRSTLPAAPATAAGEVKKDADPAAGVQIKLPGK